MNLPNLHPNFDNLTEYVLGQADGPRRFLIDNHLALCPECSESVRTLQKPAAHWLEALPNPKPPTSVWDRLEKETQKPQRISKGGLPLPSAWTPEDLPWQEPIRWKSPLARRAQIAVLSHDVSQGIYLVAAQISAGATFPAHEHLGLEEVLILEGAYKDDSCHAQIGDFATYAAGSRHEPWAEADEGCLILARIEKGVRFLGWRGWIDDLRKRLARRR